MKKEKVLVIGGSGFLGSHVADRLSDEGYQVLIYDLSRSAFLRKDQEFVEGDILDLEKQKGAATGCRYIYNFAGLSDIDDAKDRPIDTVKLNILGCVNALEAARFAKVERFVFASSVYVYSELGSFYRASKQAAERYVESFHERYGLNYTILRYGSLYGRRADKRNAIYRFLKSALVDKAITYSGTPHSVREYINVEDAAKLSVKILSLEFLNRHLILTGAEKMEVSQLLKMITEILPDNIDINYDEQKGADTHYEISPYAFRINLGHKLVSNDYVDLGQGILDCLEEMHEKLSGSSDEK